VQAHFVAEESYADISKGHGRIEYRRVSLYTNLNNIPDWPGPKTLIRVESQRQFKKGGHPRINTETRYHVASFCEFAEALAQRIQGSWDVENKVHYVRDVTQGEDASRMRMYQSPQYQSPQIFTVARNLALNLYRSKTSTIWLNRNDTANMA
jgi:predicted transposase YbfD/YdcC